MQWAKAFNLPLRELSSFILIAGPLGQGVGNAVGMAVAEANLAARFNKPDAPKIVDHYT